MSPGLMTRVARVVSQDEIKKFFVHPSLEVADSENGSIHVSSSNFLLEMNIDSLMFDVEISSEEDPLDSETEVTDDPIRFITDFLSTGTEGDEHFQKMSSDNMGVRLEKTMSRRSSKRDLPRQLRRIAAFADIADIEHMILAACRVAKVHVSLDIVEQEFADLKEKMISKGWKVNLGDADAGKITIDISGIYQVSISVNGISWNYSFILKDAPQTKEVGVTDDPIQTFREWVDSDVFQKERQKRLDIADNAKTSSP